MKKRFTFFRCAVALLLCAVMLSGNALAADPSDALPYTGDRAAWRFDRDAAAAYADIVRDFIARLDEPQAYADGETAYNEGYVTLVDTDGGTLLWLCETYRYEGGNGGPDLIWNGESYIYLHSEEIWQWDGEKAVRYPYLGASETRANLREEGMEIYLVYGGTDYDGEIWEALYPFADGRMAEQPKWYHSWFVMYDYKLDNYGIDPTVKSLEQCAKELLGEVTEHENWPDFSYDWDTLSIYSEDESLGNVVDVWGGEGFPEFLEKYDEKIGVQGLNRAEDAAREGDGVILSANYIAKKDERWVEAGAALAALEAYADKQVLPLTVWICVAAAVAVVLAVAVLAVYRIAKRRAK